MDGTDGYSTADLEALLTEIPDRLQTFKVAVSPANYSGSRQPDILFDHAEATLPEVLELIGLSQPKVVFLMANLFDSSDLAEGRERDLPGVEFLVRSRAEQDDEIFGLTLTWVLDGVLCSWLVRAKWYEDLLDEVEIAVEAAKGIDDIDRDLRQEQNREQFARCRALVLADGGFRGATVNKRTTVVKMILAAHGEVVEDPWLERHLIKEVRQEAAIEVARQEELLESRLSNLAARLVDSDLWVNVRTQGQQRTAVARFIVGESDGWMLSESFLEQARLAALSEATKRRRH